MNEPHDVPDIATWVDSVQHVVNAVRAAGSQNFLLLPGSSWSSAQAFPTEAGPLLVKVTDPLGGNRKLIFDGKSVVFYQRMGSGIVRIRQSTSTWIATTAALTLIVRL